MNETEKELQILQDNYQEENIVTLEWQEHIRRRPGMYIGKLGDGSTSDDGIYVLLKEVLDNSIDEYMMGFGKTIEINIDNHYVTVRDYGRGVPLGKLKDVCSKMNTGAKYDSRLLKIGWSEWSRYQSGERTLVGLFHGEYQGWTL